MTEMMAVQVIRSNSRAPNGEPSSRHPPVTGGQVFQVHQYRHLRHPEPAAAGSRGGHDLGQGVGASLFGGAQVGPVGPCHAFDQFVSQVGPGDRVQVAVDPEHPAGGFGK